MSDRTIERVRAVYDEVHLALWAALTAFVIYFVVFVTPKLPAIEVAGERHRIQEIAAQNEAYCAKWRMGPETAMHSECISDLQQLRARIEKRFAEQFYF